LHERLSVHCKKLMATPNGLSDPARGTRGLQPQREGRVRGSAWRFGWVMMDIAHEGLESRERRNVEASG
jgi:hypothetical protein